MGKKSQTTRTTYGNTTTTNPYVTAKTDNSGTVSNFNDGTALSSVYNFVNKNMDSLLDEYLNPNLNSSSNRAKLNAFANSLDSLTSANLENSIINPLSNRNMIRSSQASDLYKNLSDKTTDAISSYVNELIAESQSNTADIINNLLKSYLLGYDVISDTQNQSLKTSQGNAATTSGSSSSGSVSTSSLNSLFGSSNQTAQNSTNSNNLFQTAAKLAKLFTI